MTHMIFLTNQQSCFCSAKTGNLADHWRLDKNVVFLNHGSFGACPNFVRKELRRWQDLLEDEPVRFFEEIASGAALQARKALARLVVCDPDDLALLENATSGMSIRFAFFTIAVLPLSFYDCAHCVINSLLCRCKHGIAFATI